MVIGQKTTPMSRPAATWQLHQSRARIKVRLTAKVSPGNRQARPTVKLRDVEMLVSFGNTILRMWCFGSMGLREDDRRYP
jgi:hypothetical protein